LYRWSKIGDDVVKLLVSTDDPILVDDGIRVKKTFVSKDRILDSLLEPTFD